jgi:hypothetical protein
MVSQEKKIAGWRRAFARTQRLERLTWVGSDRRYASRYVETRYIGAIAKMSLARRCSNHETS